MRFRLLLLTLILLNFSTGKVFAEVDYSEITLDKNSNSAVNTSNPLMDYFQPLGQLSPLFLSQNNNENYETISPVDTPPAEQQYNNSTNQNETLTPQTEDNKSLNNTDTPQAEVKEDTSIPSDATAEETKVDTPTDNTIKTPQRGIVLFNDRFTIKPELLTVVTGNTGQVKGPMGIVGRLRTYFSALLVRGKKDKFVGEGRLNARLNMAAGFNPLKSRALSSIDPAFTDALGPNQGVNVGNNDSLKTQYGFLDELNYTQNLYCNKTKTTWTQAYGLIDITDYFDQNQFAGNKGDQYTNTTFTNNRTFIPDTTSLAAVWKFKHPWINWAIAAVPMDTWQVDNAFAPVTELAFTPHFKGIQGNYRVGIFEVLGRRMGGNFFHDNVVGVNVSFDQQITKNIGIWGRFGDIGVSNADTLPRFLPSFESTKRGGNPFVKSSWFFKKRRPLNNFVAIGDYMTSLNYGANNLPVRQTFSFGMQIDKPFRIQNGTWAFAYGQNWRIFRSRPIDASNNYVYSYANFTNRACEKVLEFDYRHKINNALTITPFMQIIFSQGGHSDLLPAVVLGIRSNYKI